MLSEEFDKRIDSSLYNKQIIMVWGEITEEATLSILRSMYYVTCHTNKDKDISLLIHSPGGDVDCETAIIDEMVAIQETGRTIKTLALGKACSSATSILAKGTRGCRFARPNSTIMLHPCSFSLEMDYSGNQEVLANFLKKKTDAGNYLIAEACGKGGNQYKKFLKDIDKGLWLNSDDAVKYGIIDAVYSGPVEYIPGLQIDKLVVGDANGN